MRSAPIISAFRSTTLPRRSVRSDLPERWRRQHGAAQLRRREGQRSEGPAECGRRQSFRLSGRRPCRDAASDLIYLSDGVVNMALLNFAGAKGNDLKDPRNAVGANHFGFQVDDLAETQRRIEAAGGKFFFDLGDERKGNFERKFKDPDGVVFDISKNGWIGT